MCLMTTAIPATKPRKILWIGGSSQLARTYVSAYCKEKPSEDELFLSGYESSCPFSLAPKVSYLPLDLTKVTSADSIPSDMLKVLKEQDITSVIVSIRPLLMTPKSNQDAHDDNQRLLDGLQILLQTTLQLNPSSATSILHISSVAAVDHLKPQINHKEEDEDQNAQHTQLWEDQHNTGMAPYDQFKLDTEYRIGTICHQHPQVAHTNLRVSGLLFEEGRCIVGQSYGLQARLGVYIRTKVDMNPARNVCAAMRLVIRAMEQRQDTVALRYYYTRPTHVPDPVPMYDLTHQYQRAHKLSWYQCLFTPWFVYVGFIWALCQLGFLLGNWLPYVHATSYLLRVSLVEHSFDNSKFLKEFPEISQHEITAEECFSRRRRYVLNQKKRRPSALEHCVEASARVCNYLLQPVTDVPSFRVAPAAGNLKKMD